MTELQRQIMLDAFKQKSPVTSFLSSFFLRADRWITDTEKVDIDIVRDNEKIAVDVTPFTSGRLNVKKRWTTKRYKPPMFNEYHSYNGKEFFDRLPGVDPYQPQDSIGALIAKVTDDQAALMDVIMRAIEKMASDVFFTGKIVLINDEEIDFKQKVSHQIDAIAAWDTSSAEIYNDLLGLANVLRENGKVTLTDLIFGENAWYNFSTDQSGTLEKIFNFRRVDLADIRMPVLNTEGAAFNGIISVGSYQIRCWTYPQSYEVPTDAEIGVDSGTIPNAGNRVDYVPTDKVLGLGSGLDLRLVFGGIPLIVDRPDPRLEALGLSGFPTSMAMDFMPYAQVDRKENSMIVGVKSRPLTIPTQIDGFGWINTQP
jgi:hypothetical protein